MKCIFEINSRVALSEPAELKHDKIIKSLKATLPPWGLSKDLNIPFPGFDGSSVALLQLSKFLPNGIKMDIIYRYRNMLDDHHSSDDRIFIEFKTEKVDYQYLVETIIPQYIDIFDGYHVAVYNELLIYEDFEKSRNKNNRKTIVRVYPVVYYDTKFCKDVLKMNPKDIFKKLNGWIFDVSLHGDGILIIADTKPLSVEESDVFDIKVKTLLSYKDL